MWPYAVKGAHAQIAIRSSKWLFNCLQIDINGIEWCTYINWKKYQKLRSNWMLKCWFEVCFLRFCNYEMLHAQNQHIKWHQISNNCWYIRTKQTNIGQLLVKSWAFRRKLQPNVFNSHIYSINTDFYGNLLFIKHLLIIRVFEKKNSFNIFGCGGRVYTQCGALPWLVSHRLDRFQIEN